MSDDSKNTRAGQDTDFTPGRPARAAAPVGAAPLPFVGVQEFRKLAEAAAGNCDKPLDLVIDAQNKLNVIVRGSATNVTTVATFMGRNNKRGALQVILPEVDTSTVPGPIVDHDFSQVADAVFWSSAAVEKFLTPYYTQTLELDQLKQLVRDRFETAGVVAMIHLPDSETIGAQSMPGSPLVPGLAALVQTASGQLRVEFI